MTIIEFFGPSGCGKTFYSKILSTNLQNLGYSVLTPNIDIISKKRRKLIKIFLIFKYIFLKPIEFSKNFMIFIKFRQKSIKDYLKVFYNYFYILAIYSKRYSEEFDYIIFDEGILQGIWSLILFSKNNKIKYILEKLNIKSNLIINVNVEYSKNLSKLVNRGGRSRLESELKKGNNFLRNGYINYELIKENLKLKNIKTLEITNNYENQTDTISFLTKYATEMVKKYG